MRESARTADAAAFQGLQRVLHRIDDEWEMGEDEVAEHLVTLEATGWIERYYDERGRHHWRARDDRWTFGLGQVLGYRAIRPEDEARR